MTATTTSSSQRGNAGSRPGFEEVIARFATRARTIKGMAGSGPRKAKILRFMHLWSMEVGEPLTAHAHRVGLSIAGAKGWCDYFDSAVWLNSRPDKYPSAAGKLDDVGMKRVVRQVRALRKYHQMTEDLIRVGLLSDPPVSYARAWVLHPRDLDQLVDEARGLLGAATAAIRTHGRLLERGYRDSS